MHSDDDQFVLNSARVVFVGRTEKEQQSASSSSSISRTAQSFTPSTVELLMSKANDDSSIALSGRAKADTENCCCGGRRVAAVGGIKAAAQDMKEEEEGESDLQEQDEKEQHQSQGQQQQHLAEASENKQDYERGSLGNSAPARRARSEHPQAPRNSAVDDDDDDDGDNNKQHDANSGDERAKSGRQAGAQSSKQDADGVAE